MLSATQTHCSDEKNEAHVLRLTDLLSDGSEDSNPILTPKSLSLLSFLVSPSFLPTVVMKNSSPPMQILPTA